MSLLLEEMKELRMQVTKMSSQYEDKIKDLQSKLDSCNKKCASLEGTLDAVKGDFCAADKGDKEDEGNDLPACVSADTKLTGKGTKKKLAKPQLCAEACKKSKSCVAWSFYSKGEKGKNCYFYSSESAESSKKGWVSAKKGCTYF